MGRACFSLSLIFLLIACTQQLGVLYVNNIIGNSDFANVFIEQSIINDNSLLTTYINGLVDCQEPRTPCGVYVETVNYYDGNVDVPVNLEVFLNTTIEGAFYPNGGIHSDSFPTGDYSFYVEDNTGNTNIIGELRLYGGLIADDGVFTIADYTGETTIAVALFKPNGGINVQDGQFTVAKEDGTFYTSSFANVQGDFYLGTSVSEDRYITRYPASSSFGGDTILLGQSNTAATGTGGNIILEPGVGQSSEIGKIILGRQANDNIYFGRPPVDESGASGGDTTIFGQDAAYGDGGNLVFSSGDSTSAGNGGDLVLDVGSSETGVHGEIILGYPVAPYSFYNLFVTRPDLDYPNPYNGGATYFSGQSTHDGIAGDMYLRAGSIVTGEPGPVLDNGIPGDTYLAPGVDINGQQGTIFLGRSTPVDINVRRYPYLEDTGNAGATFINALIADAGRGGDLFIEAGDGVGDGGDVHLKLGDIPETNSVSPGQIYWGYDYAETSANSIFHVSRADSLGAGGSTNIEGQTSVTGTGGGLTISGGYGSGTSGSVSLTAGLGIRDDGGYVTVTGGDGEQNGGPISVTAGSSGGAGADVTFTAGSANPNAGSVGGSIILNAGSGASLGDVQIINAHEVNINSIATTLFDYLQITTNSGNNIVFQANPESILSYNGQTLIKDRIHNVQQMDGTALPDPPPQPYPYEFPIDAVQKIQFLQGTVQNLINALSQCGHGLFHVEEGTNFACILPGSVPTPISRPV